MKNVLEVVGSTPAVPGVAEGKVCAACDGDGILEGDNGRQGFCNPCGGRGGTDAAAVSKARDFSVAYARALGVNDPG